MKRNLKYVIYNFLPYQYEYFQGYLEKMALKGWKVKEFSGSILTFEKIEPRVIRYSIDIVESISIFDSKNSDNSMEYREFCFAAGWNFLCENNKLQIYYSEENSQGIEIHTDQLEKFKLFRKASIKAISLELLVCLILASTQLLNFFTDSNLNFLANDINIFMILLVSLYLIVDVNKSFEFLNWNIKSLKAIKLGDRPSYGEEKLVKRENILSNLLLITSLVGILIFAFKGDNIFISAVAIILIPIIVMFFLKNKIEKSEFSSEKKKKSNIIAIVIVPTILTFLLMIGTMFLIFSDSPLFKSNEKKFGVENVPLTLEDFHLSSEEEPFYRTEKGVVASLLKYNDYANDLILSYDIFESNFSWIVKENLKKVLSYNRMLGDELKLMESDLEKGIELYIGANENQFILKSKNKIVEFSLIDYSNLLEGRDKNDIIKLVYEKLIV
ncbi:MAG: DUF2812 domain-containing protein [Sarcina sp.]